MKAKSVSNTRIYLDTTKLLNIMTDVTVQYPKAFKFTLGERSHRLAVTMLAEIAEAYAEQDKTKRIDRLAFFRSHFEVMKTLVRIAAERQWMSVGRQAEIIELMDGIGRQAEAWRNSLVKAVKGSAE